MTEQRFHARPEEIYARHPRTRIVCCQFPPKQAGYDTDWPLPCKIGTLDYMQIVLNYVDPRVFKVKGNILYYALQIWSNAGGELLAPVWLPVRKIGKKRLAFANHTPRFQDDAITALDAACYAPIPELHLDPTHLRWIREFPQPVCRVGRGYRMGSPGGSDRIPTWLKMGEDGWEIKK